MQTVGHDNIGIHKNCCYIIYKSNVYYHNKSSVFRSMFYCSVIHSLTHLYTESVSSTGWFFNSRRSCSFLLQVTMALLLRAGKSASSKKSIDYELP
mmetsp:Transcript_4700/g.6973  ORF Transcript_4700/g.6973 Transcript_4700/m.6973 type:complete len:96 (+) Transcript_4700:2067-2354(+)